MKEVIFIFVNALVLREDEDRRRREHMLLEEERLRREKEDMDYRYQKELKDR